MPVPKRKHSKRRSKMKRAPHYVRKLKKKVKQVIKTDRGTYKRPHVDEEVEI